MKKIIFAMLLIVSSTGVFAQKKQPQMISEVSISAESEVHQSIAICSDKSEYL